MLPQSQIERVKPRLPSWKTLPVKSGPMSRSAVSDTEFEDDTAASGPGLVTRLRAWLVGSVMLLAGLYLFAALLSHNILDPSWNVASDQPVRNWMGPVGAGISDTLLQTLGWASGGPALALTLWGGLLLAQSPRPGGRLVLRP